MSQPVIETWGPTAVNAIAVLAAAGRAVWGSIRGAREGAKRGAEASLAATKAFTEEQEQRECASVRLRLRLEIDHNLGSLRELQSKLIAAATPKPSKDEENSEDEEYAEEPKLSWDTYGRAFVHGSMPAWTREAWESVTAFLSPALEPKEIEHANRFYGQLETISGIREQLTGMLNEKPHIEDWGSLMGGPRTIDPMTYHYQGPRLASEVNKIMTDLLDRGNPIAEHEDGATEAAP
jgi:hypothetical protein